MQSVYILLDRSGSMTDLMEEAIGSINSYVRKLDEATRVTLVAFDSEAYSVIRDNVPVWNYQKIVGTEVTPRGMTPLYDSTARLISKMFNDNPEKAVLVIMTDGHENCSRDVTLGTVQSRIKEAEGKGWQVLFLGANFDKVDDVSLNLGKINLNQTINVTRGNFDKTFNTVACYTQSYFAKSDAINFTAEDKKKATTS